MQHTVVERVLGSFVFAMHASICQNHRVVAATELSPFSHGIYCYVRNAQVLLTEASDCTFYTSKNFKGRQLNLSNGESVNDLGDVDFDNDIQSYSVGFASNAILCNGENLSRTCVSVLRSGNLPSKVNKKVSSITCVQVL